MMLLEARDSRLSIGVAVFSSTGVAAFFSWLFEVGSMASSDSALARSPFLTQSLILSSPGLTVLATID
jgi:hypothetical protein